MTHKEIITKAFGLWLAAGCKTYGKKPEEIAAQMPFYVELLSDISPERLREACRQCATTCADFPSVADVRKAVEERREQLRATGEAPSKAHEDCPWCGGSGWAPVGCFMPIADDGTTSDIGQVTRCRCLQPGFTLPPVEPRKQIEAGEFREIFEDAVKRREM